MVRITHSTKISADKMFKNTQNAPKDFGPICLLKLETVKESRKNWNFHFDLQLVPIVLEVTCVYCQEAAVISQKAQNFQFVE